MKKCAVLIIMALTLSLILPFAFARADDVNTITILPYDRQKITGWGCYSANYYGGYMNKSKTSNTDTSFITRKAAMSMLFNDMGITILRGELLPECGNGDGSLNNDWMDKITAAIKMGQDAGIKEYLITSWSPPYEMQGTSSSGWTINMDYVDNFCKFVVNAFDYMTSHGVTAPTAYSVQNEPTVSRNYTMENYAIITKKMRKALDEGGYKDVRLIGSEDVSYQHHKHILGINYSQFYNDPEFCDALDTFATHAYCAVIPNGDYKDIDVYKFAMNCSNFPEKERWETEYSGGRIQALDNINMDLGDALRTTETMLADIMFGGINCWMYWNGYEYRQFTYPDKTIRFMEKSGLGGCQSLLIGDGFGYIKKNLVGVALSTVWKNVPVGSTVRWCWTDDDDLFNSYGLRSDLGAFIREDGTTVLEIVNEGNQRKTYNINGLGGVSAKIYTIDPKTDQDPTLSFRNVVDGSIENYVCEPYTITTIVTENKDVSEAKITLIPDEVSDLTDGILTVPYENAKVSGYLDEKVPDLTVNGKKLDISDDLEFSYEFNAKETNTLTFRCADPASGKKTTETVSVILDGGFINLNVETVPEKVNYTDYTFKITTGIPTDVYINGEKMNTEKSSSFEIPVKLLEGDNKFDIAVVSSTSRAERTYNIFCDSIAPEIIFDDVDRTTNDFEYMIPGKVSEPVSSLNVGGTAVTVNPDLTFCAKVVLEEGENTISAAATDLMDNSSKAELKATYTKDEDTPHYVNSKLYVRKADEKMTIDGVLNEKSWKTNIKICKQVVGDVGANNICSFGLLWDENYLYIGAKVKDTQAFFAEAKPYNNDSIEFLFNPSASRSGGFIAGDKQIFSGPIYSDPNQYYYNAKTPNMLTKYIFHDGGYEAEIAVPWKEIEKEPGLGEILGFEIVCNDDDITGTARTSIMSWSTPHSSYNTNTAGYGILELVEKDDFRYEDIPYVPLVEAVTGDATFEQNGITYNELGLVCEKYGAAFYDNPNTGLVNIFTSPFRRIDITEGAYQTFVDNNIAKWTNPVIKIETSYYIDEECEKMLFQGIEPFEKYGKRSEETK